jgi:alpha-L-rhamnosidase
MAIKTRESQLPALTAETVTGPAEPGRLTHQNPQFFNVTGLKVDYVVSPLGLGNACPTLSWRMESGARNAQQRAYRVLVASNAEFLRAGRADLWDSGKLLASDSYGVNYNGLPLLSRQRCSWVVQIWDEFDRSAVSEVSWWEMGLLSPTDWSAQWLAADDAVAKNDRDAETHWIWGTDLHDDRPRRFQARFSLPTCTRSGNLFFAERRGAHDTRIAAVWLDGKLIGELGTDFLSEPVYLEPLSEGEHLLCVEVVVKSPLPERIPETGRPYGLAALARFEMQNGNQFRFTSGPTWQTSLALHTQDQCDSSWAAVRIAIADNVVVDPAMHLRRLFPLADTVSVARLYITALGAYEARLNGRRVGDALLTPEVSQYEKRLLYRTYDVTDLVQVGSNVLALTVGDGWYASHPGRYSWGPPPRRVIAQLELLFSDGSRQVVATDQRWRISRSPIVRSELCAGEFYDARLEQLQWDTAGFNAAHWGHAQLATAPPCDLTAHVAPPIRATTLFSPQSIKTLRPSVHVVDFGQNFAGWCRLKVKGKAGTCVRLRFAETLLPSGEIDQFVLLGGRSADTYLLAGSLTGEVFEPHFTYHGFRYVEVAGLPEAPSFDSLVGIAINSDLEITGRLHIDNGVIESTWHNTTWSQRSNFIGIPVDCPNRGERMGYMGDAGLFWDTASFYMDLAAFTRRHMDNVRDAQLNNGAFPVLAPGKLAILKNDSSTAPGWADGGVILPWTCWQRYGDLGIIECNWDAMERYLRFLSDNNGDGIWRNKHGPDYGDWVAIGENSFLHPEQPPTTPIELIATAYWAHSTELLAAMADASGRAASAVHLRATHARISAAFKKEFVKDSGEVGNGSQTSYVLALKYHLLPVGLRRPTADHLVANIRARDGALSTGILGTQYVLDVLADTGHTDLVYDLLLREKYPSWGFMARSGATTIWERWDGSLQHQYACASHNHYALGSICGFMFRRIAGICATSPGYRTIEVNPILDPRVKRGGGDYDSILGRFSTRWSQEDDGAFVLNVTIPANASARIHLPAHIEDPVLEGQRPVYNCNELSVIRRTDEELVIDVGSGAYTFTVGA